MYQIAASFVLSLSIGVEILTNEIGAVILSVYILSLSNTLKYLFGNIT